MQIVHHKPAARGVNQLMYVGDAEVTPALTPSGAVIAKIALLAGLAWLLLRR